jgi:hypothetical protein
VTCLRHAAIVETQKSVNTLRNNRGSGVYSVPCRAEPHCTAPRSLPCNRQRNNATTVARISLTQLNYIAIVLGVSVQRSYPEDHRRYRVSFKRSSKSKFSVGDRYGKFVCEEDATCEVKVLFEVCYEDYDR